MLHALMLYHSIKNIHKKYIFFHITTHFLYFSIGNSRDKRQGSERKEKKNKKAHSFKRILSTFKLHLQINNY